jgi:hypothetical protein
MAVAQHPQMRTSLHRDRTRLTVIAATGWLLILPALSILGLALVRNLQPAGREPAQTASAILAWMAGAMTPTTAAMVFIALPVLALIAGAVVLATRWRTEPQLHADVLAAARLVRGNLATLLIAAATVLAAAVVAAVTGHLIIG